MSGRTRRSGLLVGISLLAAALTAACSPGSDGSDLPPDAELEELYGASATARMNGNVVDVRVRQEDRHLQRGGRLWARVGPYIYLFSPQTRELFESYPGVAGVRVRTVNEGDEWIAEATLRADALNPITWEDARRVVTRARREGTEKPGYLEDLIGFGEEHTEHRYNPSFLER